MTYKQDRWNLYANYTYVDATFQNALTLQSPFNPFADANGNIFVVPGDHIPGIPDFRFKLGGEYRITDPWLFGADLNVIGSQWLIGDQSNQNPKLPAYWVVNLHSSYKVTENIEVFGLVRNLFNQHYAVLGTFFDVTSYPYLGLTDPRTFVPGIPFAGYLRCDALHRTRAETCYTESFMLAPGRKPMRRREFITRIGSAAAVLLLQVPIARAQEPGRIYHSA